ncbi:hypothetical protein M885DRAFT_513297 [Pelagophyceae sp. CCMP2097]|nr:hypothetical protein M885DRAFT_513297 [Pelagophyceae sp. CCMP2097]
MDLLSEMTSVVSSKMLFLLLLQAVQHSNALQVQPCGAVISRRHVLGVAATAALSVSPRWAIAVPSGVVTLPSGVTYEDVKRGDKSAAMPKRGDKVTIDYTAWLDGFDGEKMFSQVPPSRFVKVPLDGTGSLLPGLVEGLLADCRVGTTRRIVVPAAQGYAADGYPRSGDRQGAIVPPGAALYFEVRLRSIALSSGGPMGLNVF